MKKGKFVVVYGANNLGKSMQVELLCRKLRGLGIDLVKLKYPIYDLEPTGPLLNDFLRNGAKLGEYEAQSIFAQNRRDYEPRVKQHLSSGKWVVAEDYKGTGICWGATNGVHLKKMLELNSDLLEEDLGILLDGERFTSSIEKGHHNEDGGLWEKGREMHRNVGAIFDWQVVNANMIRAKVADEIFSVVNKKFSIK